MKPKQLVLIGGGHAHMVTLANLRAIGAKGCRVTVIQPSDHHYYSGMGPGMLGGKLPAGSYPFCHPQGGGRTGLPIHPGQSPDH